MLYIHSNPVTDNDWETKHRWKQGFCRDKACLSHTRTTSGESLTISFSSLTITGSIFTISDSLFTIILKRPFYVIIWLYYDETPVQ